MLFVNALTILGSRTNFTVRILPALMLYIISCAIKFINQVGRVSITVSRNTLKLCSISILSSARSFGCGDHWWWRPNVPFYWSLRHQRCQRLTSELSGSKSRVPLVPLCLQALTSTFNIANDVGFKKCTLGPLHHPTLLEETFWDP